MTTKENEKVVEKVEFLCNNKDIKTLDQLNVFRFSLAAISVIFSCPFKVLLSKV